LFSRFSEVNLAVNKLIIPVTERQTR